MHPRIRIIRHEVIPECGSFEVRFADGRPSRYFYWDNVLARGAAAGQSHQRAGAGASQGVCEGGTGHPSLTVSMLPS